MAALMALMGTVENPVVTRDVSELALDGRLRAAVVADARRVRFVTAQETTAALKAREALPLEALRGVYLVTRVTAGTMPEGFVFAAYVHDGDGWLRSPSADVVVQVDVAAGEGYMGPVIPVTGGEKHRLMWVALDFAGAVVEFNVETRGV